MIRRSLLVALLVAMFAASALASDIARHANYTEKDASGAVAQKCKDFAGTDDNRTACTDWCTEFKAAQESAACACDEGICPVKAAQPAEAPATPPAH